MRKILASLLLCLWSLSAQAGSTINPNLPAQNASLSSAPVRGNFQAAYNDVNNILGCFAASTAPLNPTTLQFWCDTTSAPTSVQVKQYDGAQWVQTGTINQTAHSYVPAGAADLIVGTSVVNSGTSNGLLFDSAGVLGNASVSNGTSLGPYSSGSTLGSWWSDQGSMSPYPIVRARDRLCVDDGCLISSALGSPTSPLPNTRSGADLNAVGGGWVKVPNLYSLYVLSSTYHGAIAGQSTTSGQTCAYPCFGSQAGVGVLGMALSNNVTYATTAWGGYFEGAKTNTTNANYAFGVEIDVDNAWNSNVELPIYGAVSGGPTIAAQLDCGGLAPSTTTYNCSTGLQIITNPAVGTPEFLRGINFGNNSVALDGTTSLYQAINFPTSYSVVWYRNNSGADQVQAYISASDTTTSDPIQSLVFGSSDTMTLTAAIFEATGKVGIQTASPDSPLEINLNTGATVALASAATIHTVQADAVSNLMTEDSYGSSSINGYGGRLAGGILASPTAAAAATGILSLFAQGYDGVSAYGTIADIRFNTVNQTSTSDHSGLIVFRTVATGATGSPVQRAQIEQGLSVGTATDPGAGNVLASGSVGSQSISVSGSASSAAWTTSGVRYVNPPVSYTDSSSSGTVAAAYTDLFGISTILASSATTYTNYYGSYFQNPVASTNVTMTSKYALGADSLGVVGSTLAAGGNVINVTATQPSSPVAAQNAILITVTGAGSAAQNNHALDVIYSAGYTGANRTAAIQGANGNAGTGSTLVPASGSNTLVGNIGFLGTSTGATTGLNAGIVGEGSVAAISAGLVGLAQIVQNSGTNIGVVGSAINTGTSPVEVGGWFSLNQTTTPTVSAALIADTAGQNTQPIALFQVGAVTKASVNATGGITATLTSVATTSAVCYNTGTLLFSYDAAVGTCNTSDERLKTFDRPIDHALAKLVDLSRDSHFGYFHASDDPRAAEQFGAGEHIGAGAQTVARYFPEMTATGDDGLMSLAYDKLTVPIIAAIAELKAANDDLRAEVRELKSGTAR